MPISPRYVGTPGGQIGSRFSASLTVNKGSSMTTGSSRSNSFFDAAFAASRSRGSWNDRPCVPILSETPSP